MIILYIKCLHGRRLRYFVLWDCYYYTIDYLSEDLLSRNRVMTSKMIHVPNMETEIKPNTYTMFSLAELPILVSLTTCVFHPVCTMAAFLLYRFTVPKMLSITDAPSPHEVSL